MSDRAPLFHITHAEAAALVVSILNSTALDFTARVAVGGTDLSYFIIKQLPVLPPTVFQGKASSGHTHLTYVMPRVLELTYTAWDLEPFARDCGYDGPPFKWDEERRFFIRCELDAAFFHLYLPSTPDGDWKPARKAEGAVVDETPEQLAELKKYFPTPRDAVAYIMETFPIVKRKDEQKYGEYRTKRVILEIYDEMQRVMAENVVPVAAGKQPTTRYQTRLDPPPGPPCDAQGNFIPMAQWDRAHWPPHIHLPREVAAPVPSREEVKIGRAVLYVALLLREWGKPVVRDTLEAGLVLMLNDSVRKGLLRGKPLGDAKGKAKEARIVVGMDGFLANLKASGVIGTHIRGDMMVVESGSNVPSLDAAPSGDVARATEAVQAVDKLGESRTLLNVLAGVIDGEYALVS